MPSILRLSLLPLVGLLFLIAAYNWSARELRLRLTGSSVDGTVVGMVLTRGDQHDLLSARELDLALHLADGSILRTRHRNNAAAQATWMPRSAAPTASSLSITDLLISSTASPLPVDVRRVLADCVEGDATRIRWALQREARRATDPKRVIRIELTETSHGWFGLNFIPETFQLAQGEPSLGEDHAAARGQIRIRAIFDMTEPERVRAAKGESLVEYTYERLGASVSPERRNVYLHAEPYATEFRPVFGYRSDGIEVARLSHIGRRGGPTLALRLFRECRVYFDPENPRDAILTALPGPVGGKPLDWFSRLCEGIFAQWGSTALIALAGCMFIVTGLVFATLALRPSNSLSSPHH